MHISRSEMKDKEQQHSSVWKQEKDEVVDVNEKERRAKGERRGTAH